MGQSTDDSELDFQSTNIVRNACGEAKTSRYNRPKNKRDKLAERELVATRRSKHLADLKATEKEKSNISVMV